ncbi:hypothetical protein [Treponema denticola]|uniref:hypothetical protein n=1 Tax=Treponema denticola TaxID=158 RepID=UPI002105FC03|nr:hypothetical protein [Treponema denticola]
MIFLNFSTLISHKTAYLTLKDIRCAVCDKFIRVPMGYFDKNSSTFITGNDGKSNYTGSDDYLAQYH